MKRLVTLLIACFVSGLCFVIVPSAIADKPPAPPGQGECNHGNSNQPCKPDPQPEHGKDCDTHGNNGGVNEDHCLGTTTTPSTTTTTTTTTRETTSTQTETTPQTTSTPTGTSEQTTSTTNTTNVEGTTTVIKLPIPKCDDGSNPPCPTPDPAPPLKQERKAQLAGAVKGELPFTGFPLIFVALAGLSMTTVGLYLRRKDER